MFGRRLNVAAQQALPCLQGERISGYWGFGPAATDLLSRLVWIADLLVPKSRTPVRLMCLPDSYGQQMLATTDGLFLPYAQLLLMSPDHSMVYARGNFAEEEDIGGTFALRQHTEPGVLDEADKYRGLGALLYYGGALASGAFGGPGAIFSPKHDRTPDADRVWRVLVKLGMASEHLLIVPSWSNEEVSVNLLELSATLHSGLVLAINTEVVDLEEHDVLRPPVERLLTLDLTHTPGTVVKRWVEFLAGRDPHMRQNEDFTRDALAYLQTLHLEAEKRAIDLGGAFGGGVEAAIVHAAVGDLLERWWDDE